MCFVVLLMRILRVSELSESSDNQMMAAGIFGWIASHFVINIMAMIGIIPLTGITLPLLSYGGTSMMIVALVLGIALQLSMYTLRVKKDRIEKHGRRKK
jgi:cell division protein FtsW